MTVRICRRQAICRVAFAIAGSLASFSGSDTALAQAWPSKAITAIAPFAAGSAADVLARVVFDQVSKQVGQPVIVENRAGAGGTIGANAVAKAAPDGHTILVTGALSAAHAIYRALPYATLRDFTPVIPLGGQPLVLVAAPSKGLKTLGDLIAAARQKPGNLNFASAGVGSATHFAGERLRVSAGVEFQHIPFRGPAAALTEVLTGRGDFLFLPTAAGLPLIRDGKVVPLAISASKRTAVLPQVPTTAEAGFVNSAYDFWVGLFLPANTSRDIVARLHSETARALQAPAVRERLARIAVEPMPMSQGEFAAYFRADVEANANLVVLAKIAKQ